MELAIYYKILQRRNFFRNSDNLIRLRSDFIYTEDEYVQAQRYILNLMERGVSFTHPEKSDYPLSFLSMKEPPLFLEFIGPPLWLDKSLFSVVGTREMSDLTLKWMQNQLGPFFKKLAPQIVVVSGGARGVDQMAHLTSMKNDCPTLVVLPTGLGQIYPKSLRDWRDFFPNHLLCFISEFEFEQSIRKEHFYFRNRLIAALGQMTLVTQAAVKSGSFLTVHHTLENGRPVLTVPAHPELNGFDGNIKLLQDGATLITGFHDLLDFWMAESSSNNLFTTEV